MITFTDKNFKAKTLSIHQKDLDEYEVTIGQGNNEVEATLTEGQIKRLAETIANYLDLDM